MFIAIQKNLNKVDFDFPARLVDGTFIGIDKSSLRRVITQNGRDPMEYDFIEVKPNGVPASALCYFKEGDKFQCVFGDFINLQESPAGFGDTYDEAFEDLKKNWEIQKAKRSA